MSMRHVYGNPEAVAAEIGCRFRQETDKIVSPRKFGIVAKALWPLKTAAHIASIAKTSERVAARWLSGEHEPPGCVLAAILTEITAR